MKAVTDSGSEIKFGKDKPAVSNLLTIYSLLANQDIKTIEKEYAGRGYGDFKKGLAQKVTEFITDFQLKFNSLNDSEVRQTLAVGAKKARDIAEKKMDQVKRKIGIK